MFACDKFNMFHYIDVTVAALLENIKGDMRLAFFVPRHRCCVRMQWTLCMFLLATVELCVVQYWAMRAPEHIVLCVVKSSCLGPT